MMMMKIIIIIVSHGYQKQSFEWNVFQFCEPLCTSQA